VPQSLLSVWTINFVFSQAPQSLLSVWTINFVFSQAPQSLLSVWTINFVFFEKTQSLLSTRTTNFVAPQAPTKFIVHVDNKLCGRSEAPQSFLSMWTTNFVAVLVGVTHREVTSNASPEHLGIVGWLAEGLRVRVGQPTKPFWTPVGSHSEACLNLFAIHVRMHFVCHSDTVWIHSDAIQRAVCERSELVGRSSDVVSEAVNTTFANGHI